MQVNWLLTDSQGSEPRGKEIVQRLSSADWSLLSSMVHRDASSPIELVPVIWLNPMGQEVVTPMHFDLGTNLHCVMSGSPKHFWLLSPDSKATREYPLLHPMARQATHFSLDQTWARSHPEARSELHYAHVEPGECIVLPMCWWHEAS